MVPGVARTKFLGAIYLRAQISWGPKKERGPNEIGDNFSTSSVGCSSLFSTSVVIIKKSPLSSIVEVESRPYPPLWKTPCGRLHEGFLCDIIDGPHCIFSKIAVSIN